MARLQDIGISNRWPIHLLFVLLTLGLTTACSQQWGVLSSGANARHTQDLPFDRTSEKSGISPTQAFASMAIPAGTPLIVRLQSSLSSANSRSGDAFQAVLEEPIVVQGQTLAPRGATITGRVVSATAANPPQQPGYLRIALSSIALNGKTVEMHTSGLFAKGIDRGRSLQMSAEDGEGEAEPGNVEASGSKSMRSGMREAKFSTAQRLTFRLVQSLPL